MTPNCSAAIKWMRRRCLNLRGVIRTSPITFNGRSYQNLESFAPAGDWEELSCAAAGETPRRGTPMIFSHTQISQYLRCPRSYRYRYLDGWQEKETRAAMVFGRSFEKALGAYFSKEDSSAVLFKEWGAYRDAPFEYKKGRFLGPHGPPGSPSARRSSLRMIGFRFPSRRENLQVKLIRSLPGDNEFVAYIDALGELDGTPCVIDWKTTTSRYPEEPEGLLALDPQLICYSWISGISGSRRGRVRAQEACLRFNTCGPRFPKSNDGSTAGWLKPRLARSKRASSFRTAASASLRTAA